VIEETMTSSDLERRLLEAIDKNPDATQAGLATQLDVAVGSVNWYMKRLVRKGYVKATQMQRRRLKYFLTPKGLAVKARLTREYMKASLRVYRELRRSARGVLTGVKEAGYQSVQIEGNDEVIEIFRLSCMEQAVKVRSDSVAKVPTVFVEGTGFAVRWPEE
jgi:DNA-binding MarR family transcriptional regulator